MKFHRSSRTIPLELNYWNEAEERYVRLSDLPPVHPVRLREIYFEDNGEVCAKVYNFGTRNEHEEKGKSIAVQWVTVSWVTAGWCDAPCQKAVPDGTLDSCGP